MKSVLILAVSLAFSTGAFAFCVVTNGGCQTAGGGTLVERDGHYVDATTGERVMDVPPAGRIPEAPDAATAARMDRAARLHQEAMHREAQTNALIELARRRAEAAEAAAANAERARLESERARREQETRAYVGTSVNPRTGEVSPTFLTPVPQRPRSTW